MHIRMCRGRAGRRGQGGADPGGPDRLRQHIRGGDERRERVRPDAGKCHGHGFGQKVAKACAGLIHAARAVDELEGQGAGAQGIFVEMHEGPFG